jgi:hypothetical protein
MRTLLALLLLLVPSLAFAQQPTVQSGNVTPGHIATWVTNGILADGGIPGGPIFTGSTITNDFACAGASGIIIDCGLSAVGTNAWTGLQNFNGGATAPTRNPGDNTTNVATTAFVQAQALTVGASGIIGGTPNGLLYNNGGVLGNLASITATAGGPLTINPTALTANQGVLITQTGPTTGTTAGPLSYNLINVTHQSTVTGSGSAGFLVNTNTTGLRVNMTTGGGNLSGQAVSAGIFSVRETITGVTTGAPDKIGVVGAAFSNVSDPSGSGIYGVLPVAGLDGGTATHMIGAEADLGIINGGVAVVRAAFRAVNQGTARATTLDAAFMVANFGGTAAGVFGNLLAFTQANGFSGPPISTTGNFFISDAAMTVANIFNLPTVTVTGNIFNFPHILIAGPTGFISSAANNSALAAAPSGTQVQVSAGDNIVTNILADSFGSNAGSYFYSRAARGSAGAPTALQSGDTIGGLIFAGYGSTAYSGGRASISGVASQIWTDANQGAYVSFGSTPNNSTTQAERARITDAGLIAFPQTTLPPAFAGSVIQAAGPTPFIVSDSFNTTPGAYFGSRAARGTPASPSALQSADNIGGLAFSGYGATGYSSTRAGIFAYAFQNWTDANQGTYLILTATPNNSTTQTEYVRLLGSGCLSIGTTVDCAAPGIVNLLTGLRIGNAAASGNVLRGNGTNFVSATLAAADVSGAVATTRNINTTSPITGGGDLSADRTIACATCPPNPGTSGGVPYYSSTTTVASSGLMTLNGVMYGGGAGAAPLSTAQGAAGTVLHGNGGAPTFTAVSLTADVSGALPVANGGTGDTGTSWPAFTPTFSCGTATFTTTFARSKTLGKTTWIEGDFTFTALGTCTNQVNFNLPNTAASSGSLSLFNIGNNNAGSCAIIGNGATAGNCIQTGGVNYANGHRIVFSGVYENQ